MKHQAVYRNDYPLINRKKALSSKAATVEALIISKANKDNGGIVISREELAFYGVCDLGNKNIVRELELVADELLCYKVLLPEKEGWKARWRTLATKFDVSNSDSVYIEMHEDLTPYLIDLREHFTAVEVAEVASLSSKFSKRLYMLLKTLEPKQSKGYVYNPNGGGSFTLQQIKDCLGIAEEKTYKEFKFLNSQVLKPALRDLNKLSDITVTMQPEKKGRLVIAIKFTVNRRSSHQQKLPSFSFPEPKEQLSSSLKKLASKYNFHDTEFLLLAIEQHGEKALKLAFQTFENKYMNPNIKNPAGLFSCKFPVIMSEVLAEQAAEVERKTLQKSIKAEQAKKDQAAEVERLELLAKIKGNERALYEKQDDSFKSLISFEDCNEQMFIDMIGGSNE